MKGEDIPLLNMLFDFRIVPSVIVLERAITLGKYSMLKLVLTRLRRSQLEEYGARLLTRAILKYPESSEALDDIFAHNLNNINVYVVSLSLNIYDYQRPLQPTTPGVWRTPLGHAILGVPQRREVRNCAVRLVERMIDTFGNGIANTITTNDRHLDIYQTAILDSIDTGSIQMVDLLVQHGAKVNEPARLGLKRTPLQKAIEIGNLEIIRLLLSKGADVNAPPAARGGGTALQLAAIGGNCTIAKLLIDHGAQFNIPPSYLGSGRWPLEGAAEHGRLDMIQFLWNANHGQFDDRQCERAKRFAEYYGHNACRDLINELMAAREAMS
ncbi:ankyrin repeat-containing domain protein [Rostrohypoxylon terebratum]|nr:ankyrin repeat-containing domain protein [Rostrohypoxylon terebratum]